MNIKMFGTALTLVMASSAFAVIYDPSNGNYDYSGGSSYEDPEDALGGAGYFMSNESAAGWNYYIYTYPGYKAAYTGSITPGYDGGDNYVLAFWTNGRSNEDWHLQASHSISLERGYSYQVVGYAYLYDDTEGGFGVGLQTTGADPDIYFSDKVYPDMSDNGFFYSTTYVHCDADDSEAKFVINANSLEGNQVDPDGSFYYGGGMGVMYIQVDKRPASCGSYTPKSSSSRAVVPASSASRPASSASQHYGNRIGPVSQYGQLQVGTNSAGKGRIYGSCPAYNSDSGNEVQVKGMSLFWSIDANAAKFWKKSVVDGLVQQHNIQLIRAAMGVDEDWGDGNYFTDESYYAGLMDDVVQAAIDNDIYVIIDYHSHKANYHVSDAKSFFTRMAKKWGAYDNVIFEIFNEPYCVRNSSDECVDDADKNAVLLEWPTIKSYANQVISAIRQYSDNLIIVGTRAWDQHPEDAIGSTVTDPANNSAYALHYYASSHGSWLRTNGEKAMNAGLPIFVSEWGTIYASGRGEVATTANADWQSWLNKNKISSANWSVGNKVEGKYEDDGTYVGGDGQGGSYFAANFMPTSATQTWSYSTSGKWVNANVFASLPKDGDYVACDGSTPTPKSSSSSVKPTSSSAVVPVSSSAVRPASSAGGSTSSDYLDDLEDGDNITNTAGYWMAYNDNGSVDEDGFSPSSYITNEVLVENADGTGGNIYQVVFPGINDSKYVAGLQGITLVAGYYAYDPYVVLALALDSTGAPYDLSKCSSISYDYKGAAHNFEAVMYNDFQGAVTDFNFHKTPVAASSSWKNKVVSWTSLKQEDGWGKPATLKKNMMGRFLWEVKDDAYSYLYVDNVRCVGGSTVASSSSVKPVSSSAVRPASSSAVRPASSSAFMPLPYSSSSIWNMAVGESPVSLGGKFSVVKNGNTLQVTGFDAGAFKVQVFDVMGNVVVKKSGLGKVAIPLNMAGGSYVVRISGRNGSVVTKLNVQ